MSELLCVLWPAGNAEPHAGGEIELTAGESHHLVRVRRAREGDEVWAVVGDGRGVHCHLTRADADAARLEVIGIVENWREPSVHLTLYLAPIRTAAFETVLSWGTALGLSRLVPLLCERIERPRLNYGRLARLAAEAAKQCGRGLIPPVCEPVPARQLFSDETGEELLLIADSSAIRGLTGLRDETRWDRIDRLGLVIGPEGGLTDDELATAVAGGGHLVHLGARRLRTETAAIAALSLILNESE